MTHLDRRTTEREINTNMHVIVRGTKKTIEYYFGVNFSLGHF